MTRLSYARVLIEVDLMGDLPSSVNVVLPNGSNLAQQVLYESLPRFCKSCHVLGHSENACRKGAKSKRKTRSLDIHEDSENACRKGAKSKRNTVRGLLLTLLLTLCPLKWPPLRPEATPPLGVKEPRLLTPSKPQILERVRKLYRLKDNT